MKQLCLWVFFLLASGLSQAQTVYERRGPNGPVFSDQPMPGARAIELPPLNIMESPRVAPAIATTPNAPTAPGSAPAAPPPLPSPYRSLSILFPENDGAVASASAVFDIRVALEPPLQLGEGHYLAATVDGRPVGRRFTSTEFSLPQEFWGDAPPVPNQRHQLDVAVRDRSGKLLKQAEPVRFTLRAPVYAPAQIWSRHPPRMDTRLRKPEEEDIPPTRPVTPQMPPAAPSRGGTSAILR